MREIAATVFKFSRKPGLEVAQRSLGRLGLIHKSIGGSLMVGQEEDEGRLEDTTEIDNAGEMILLEKAGFVHRQATALSSFFVALYLTC